MATADDPVYPPISYTYPLYMTEVAEFVAVGRLVVAVQVPSDPGADEVVHPPVLFDPVHIRA